MLRVLTRRSLVGSVSPLGSLKIPDITGEVRMNDNILPGAFASQVIAGWLDSSNALKSHYGRSLDIFQLLDDKAERSGAAVLKSTLSLASLNKSIPAYLVMQASAFDEVIEYLSFRQSEAQRFALRYAEEALIESGQSGLLIVADHSDSSPPEGARLIACANSVSFSSFRSLTSPLVTQVSCGPHMDGLFSEFNFFEELHHWEKTRGEERAMFTVSDDEGTVIAGCSMVGKTSHGECIITSPFITESATDLAAASRASEKLLLHVLATFKCSSGMLVYDEKDPFASIVDCDLLNRLDGAKRKATVKLWGIPSNLTDREKQALLDGPFQIPSELLSWNLFKRKLF